MALYIINPREKLVMLSPACIRACIDARVQKFAQAFNYDVQRLREWVFLRAASSVYWSLEDGLLCDTRLVLVHILVNL